MREKTAENVWGAVISTFKSSWLGLQTAAGEQNKNVEAVVRGIVMLDRQPDERPEEGR